jgi:hypothetical protein
MPRLTHKSLAALLTFLLGVAAATLWFSPNLHDILLNLRRSSARTEGGVCKEWAKAEVVGQGLGWDLTYRSTIERTGYCPGGMYCEEWAKPEPPIHKYFAEWQGEPIISSMEIELPDGHAGYGIIWFIRTKEHAYSWTFGTSNLDKPLNKTPFPAQHYDSAFEEVACWEQAKPPKREFGQGGYIGFLSLYKEGRARQMLLTYGDINEGDEHPDKAQPGRFTRALLPLMRWAAEQERESTPDHR